MGAAAAAIPVLTKIGAAISAVRTIKSVFQKTPKLPGQSELTGIDPSLDPGKPLKPSRDDTVETKYKAGLKGYMQYLSHASTLAVMRNRAAYESGYRKHVNKSVPKE